MKLIKAGPNNFNIKNDNDTCISFEIKCLLRDAEKKSDGWIIKIESKFFSNFIENINKSKEFLESKLVIKKYSNNICKIKILSNKKYSTLINKIIYFKADISSIYVDINNDKKNIIICKNVNITDMDEEFEEDKIDIINFECDINKYFEIINNIKEDLINMENKLRNLLIEFDLSIFNNIKEKLEKYYI